MSTKNKISKPKIVNTKKALELIGCNRAWFYKTHVPKLTVLEKLKNERVYLLSEILAIKKEKESSKNSPYKLIK